MRTVGLVLMFLVAAAAGCASSGPSRLAQTPPTEDETAGIQLDPPGHVQAHISVDRDPDTPRLRIVREFKPQPLSDEEKRALGEEDMPYKLLPYPLEQRVSGQLLGPVDGADVGVGESRSGIAADPARRDPGGAAGPFSGLDWGIDQFVTRVRGIYPASPSAHAGPEEQADVGIGPPAPKADRHRRLRQ